MNRTPPPAALRATPPVDTLDMPRSVAALAALAVVLRDKEHTVNGKNVLCQIDANGYDGHETFPSNKRVSW